MDGSGKQLTAQMNSSSALNDGHLRSAPGGCTIHFKTYFGSFSTVPIKMDRAVTTMSSSMGQVATAVHLPSSQRLLCFVDGQRAADHDSVGSLGLSDGDKVHVFMDDEQDAVPSALPETNTCPEAFSALTQADTSFLIIHVTEGQEGHSEKLTFKVKPSTKLETIFQAYAVRKGLGRAEVRFLLDGERLTGQLDVQAAGLEDGDEILAMVQNHAGNDSSVVAW